MCTNGSQSAAWVNKPWKYPFQASFDSRSNTSWQQKHSKLKQSFTFACIHRKVVHHQKKASSPLRSFRLQRQTESWTLIEPVCGRALHKATQGSQSNNKGLWKVFPCIPALRTDPQGLCTVPPPCADCASMSTHIHREVHRQRCR